MSKSKDKPSKLDAYAERLDEWFGIEKKTLAEVQEQLGLDGCSVSLSRLSAWWSERQRLTQEDKLLARIADGAKQIREVEQALSGNDVKLATLISLHRHLILKLSTEGNSDPEKLELVNRMMREVQKFVRLEQLAEQNKLEARRLELLEKQANQAEQAQQVTASELSAEEKQARMRQIFGMS